MPILLRCLVCFAIGALPFAVISMLGSGIDIRKVGSGNPGFNNVLRVSKKRAVLALLGDMGKGCLAVWLVGRHFAVSFFPYHLDPVALGWLYGFAVTLGHCFSPFLKFNGGKGIATSGGVMLVLYPRWAAIALAYFTLVRIALGKRKSREAGTMASLTAWMLFTFLMAGFVGPRDAFYALVMTVFLTGRHKKNVGNLLGTPAASDTAAANPGVEAVRPAGASRLGTRHPEAEEAARGGVEERG
jgi:acyl phosphate:glycerol-3-phosphate acyltransferase